MLSKGDIHYIGLASYKGPNEIYVSTDDMTYLKWEIEKSVKVLTKKLTYLGELLKKNKKITYIYLLRKS